MKQSPTTKAALPERLIYNHSLILDEQRMPVAEVRIRADNAEGVRMFAAEMVLRWNAHEQLVSTMGDLILALQNKSIEDCNVEWGRAVALLAQLERPA